MSSVLDCYTPLSTFAERVDDVREELRKKRGLEVKHVVVTSDERDKSWWDSVRELGWEWIDHDAMRTSEVYDSWWVK